MRDERRGLQWAKNWRLDKATNEKGTKAKFYRGYLAVCHAKNG